MSRELCEAAGVIGDHVPIDDLRELSLEAPEGFAGALVLGELAAVVIPPRSRMHDLDSSGKVQGVVERAVPPSRKTMPGDLAARHLDRGGARVAGEAARRAEAAYVSGVPQDPVAG